MICPRCASVLLGEKHADWCVRRGPSTSELVELVARQEQCIRSLVAQRERAQTGGRR